MPSPAAGKVLLQLLVVSAAVGWVSALPEPVYLTREEWWQWPAAPNSVQEAANAAAALRPANVTNDAVVVSAAAAGAEALWGKQGELWSPKGRLMDFSYAGYKQGSAPIPSPKVTKSFQEFQRRGMSDTAALQAALAWAHKQPLNKWVVIGLPAGTIRLDRQLFIRRPRLILRGAGSGKTILRIDRPLKDTPGVTPPKGGYGFYNQEAFIMLDGRYMRDRKIATVTGTARRGGRKVTVDTVSRMAVGQVVVLILSDKRGVLTRYLLNNRPLNPGSTTLNRYMVTRFASRIVAIKGKVLTLERTLPFDVRPEYLPEILPQTGTVYDVGIEGLTFKFPFAYYGGHHYEDGYNCIQLWEVYNCWVKDVHGINVDNGLFIHKSTAVQVNDLRLTQTKRRNPKKDPRFGDGHWGVHNGGSADVLVSGFTMTPELLHCVGSDAFGMYAVFSRGKMTNGNLELHRALAHALFTDIDVGVGNHALQSGGPSHSGPNTQAWTVVWNVRSSKPIPLPGANGVKPGDCAFGPDLTLAGVNLEKRTACAWWLIEKGPLSVTNLYEAQLAKRRRAQL
ncbi:hypothetical protein D9Q98_000637 [Chlorella vulgaris]|uniref:Uncharacterized protein n=1 Tax=Chlorella vulgaris TaxID=3077 RepID=A0A9D4TYH0_CHLVU|nr:hypothetical protein D9Q98_000637 [Chlorella vulgaris]